VVVRWFEETDRKIDDTGTVDRRSAPGSGRPRTARVADKIDEVDDLVLIINQSLSVTLLFL